MKKKLFLTIFRLGLFVLTSLLFLDTPASASDLSKRINIDEGSYSLSQFINMITTQSGYDFTYQAKDLPLAKKASIPMQDETVDKATEKLAKTFQLKVNILNNNIILKPGDAKGKQDTKTIKGKVLDDNGQPLPGATAVVKGTTTGTVTGTDGTFSLTAPADATTLSVTFIGMQAMDVTLDGRTSYTVNMRSETVGLDEVVAIGYGTVKKKDLTGAVGIRSEELSSRVILKRSRPKALIRCCRDVWLVWMLLLIMHRVAVWLSAYVVTVLFETTNRFILLMEFPFLKVSTWLTRMILSPSRY